MTEAARNRVEELTAQMRGSPYEVLRVEDRADGGAIMHLGGRGIRTQINVSPNGKRE